MRITLNGEAAETAQSTLAGLLAELGITRGRVAVELNLRVVSRKDFETTRLNDGDSIEVVNFVGGG